MQLIVDLIPNIFYFFIPGSTLVALIAFAFKLSNAIQTKQECYEKHNKSNRDYENKWNNQSKTLKLLSENLLQMRDEISTTKNDTEWIKKTTNSIEKRLDNANMH